MVVPMRGEPVSASPPRHYARIKRKIRVCQRRRRQIVLGIFFFCHSHLRDRRTKPLVFPNNVGCWRNAKICNAPNLHVLRHGHDLRSPRTLPRAKSDASEGAPGAAVDLPNRRVEPAAHLGFAQQSRGSSGLSCLTATQTSCDGIAMTSAGTGSHLPGQFALCSSGRRGKKSPAAPTGRSLATRLLSVPSRRRAHRATRRRSPEVVGDPARKLRRTFGWIAFRLESLSARQFPSHSPHQEHDHQDDHDDPDNADAAAIGGPVGAVRVVASASEDEHEKKDEEEKADV